MATFERDGAQIYYEEHGAGFPVLLIAPGGMRSSIPCWGNAPWNPIDELKSQFRVIAMDQRNAGRSAGPVATGDGWQTYADDQLGLMDHLGVDRFHVAGMCIGGSYSLGLINSAPQRVCSAVLFQPIGQENNKEAFYLMFDDWAGELRENRPEVESTALTALRESMYGSDRFFFNVDETFLRACRTPLCVLMGNDLYHPQSTSRLIADTAPNVLFIERWKEADAQQAARQQVREFLVSNTPQTGYPSATSTQ